VRGIAIPGLTLLTARAFVSGSVSHGSISGGSAYPPGAPLIALPGIMRIAERALRPAIDDSRWRPSSNATGYRPDAW